MKFIKRIIKDEALHLVIIVLLSGVLTFFATCGIFGGMDTTNGITFLQISEIIGTIWFLIHIFTFTIWWLKEGVIWMFKRLKLKLKVKRAKRAKKIFFKNLTEKERQKAIAELKTFDAEKAAVKAVKAEAKAAEAKANVDELLK